MKWIIAPDFQDATRWLEKNPLERGENYYIILEQTHAEGCVMYRDEVIYINYEELDHDLVATVEDNITACEGLRQIRKQEENEHHSKDSGCDQS